MQIQPQTQNPQLPPNASLGRLAMKWIWQHKWLSLIIGMLLATLIFIILTPTQPNSTIPKPGFNDTKKQTTQLKTVTFSGSEPTIPKELAVYQGATTPVSVDQFLNDLATTFGLPKVEGAQRFWFDPARSISLSYSAVQNVAIYLKEQNEYAREGEVRFDVEKSVEVARKMIQDELGYSTYEPVRENISYSGHEFDTTTAEATYIEIPFAYKLEGLPVVFADSILPPAAVTLNPEYEVIRINIPPSFPKTQVATTAPTLTTQQALDEIRANNGIVISSVLLQGGFIDIAQIQTLTLESAVVQYRFDPTNNLYYPYYEFSGTATTNKSGELHGVTIITPAVLTAKPSN